MRVKERKYLYYCINSVVLITAAFLFVTGYVIPDKIFLQRSMLYVIVVVLDTLIIHVVKAMRLYIILYGNVSDPDGFTRTYCKVAPVCVLLPFKLGDFFRMYCYGILVDNVPKGIVSVLLDRFMDTIALICMIMMGVIFANSHLNRLHFAMIIFLVIIFLVYMAFPSLYRFWNKFLLRLDADEQKLTMLRFLDAMKRIHAEVSSVSRGRGIILFFLSILSWVFELGRLVLVNNIIGEEILIKINEYLQAALGQGTSTEIRELTYISVVVTFLLYCVLKVKKILLKRNIHESNSYI